ncbi:MAG: PAS domain S-box protein, partial [Chloroflexi bacterium]|nr:PAS domain S-box protein [Chloroflexota bacterium]
MDLELYRKDGTTIWSSNTFSLIRDENGKPLSILGEGRDVTERKQAERRIQESESLYRSLIETSPNAIVLMDINGTIIMHTKQALAVFGFDLTEDLRGKNIMDMVAPENYQEIFENLEKLKKSEVIRNWELTSYKKDGRPFSIELSSSMLFDAEGKPKSIIAVFQDITERRKEEEAIRASEERFRNMANLLPQTVFETDKDSKLTFFNRQGFKMFGYSQADIAAGVRNSELIIPEDFERAANNINQRLIDEEFPSQEYTAIRKDGSKFPAAIYTTPVILNSEYAGLRGMIID